MGSRPLSRGALAATAALLALGAAACAQQPAVTTDRQVGASGRTTTLLVDGGFAAHGDRTFAAFLRRNPGGVRWGPGDPVSIATSVVQGDQVDGVIMRSGPQLDRVRNEFVEPAARIGTVGGTAYWVGALDGRGWTFATYLTSPVGRAALAAQGIGP